jgi:hypothetical protein
LATTARVAARKSAPFSTATSKTVPSPCVCPASALSTTATSGATIAPSRAISPRAEVPHSSTIAACSGPSVSTVMGTPTRLFRLPTVASVVP